MAALTAERIRELFAQEAEVRLAELGQLLLALEQTSNDEVLIGSIFRELHTLKGSSAVAGLAEVSTIAHRLEELVDDLRAQRRTATPELIDTLLRGADDLGAAIKRAVDDGEEQAVALSPARLPAGVSRQPLDLQPIGPRLKDRTETGALQLSPPASTSPAGVVMVPLERLEELARLVSESASAHLRIGRMLSDRFGIDAASSAEFNDLSRCLNELQDRTMRTQMVPVATVTDQLQRAVRDLARAQGKDIRWEVLGTDTELDRGVLRQLSDSLLHLVRNAVDHGIETPDEREAVGKHRQASIRLQAMQLGSEVIIAVSDDGRGVDLEQIRQQATGHGIDAEGMSDEDVLALALRPGVSTASFVTDVSGRGVGLDVVRANVEAARGRVEIRSQPGSGAEFRVIVPITVAVLRCLLIEAGGHRFALPFHRVVVSQADGGAGKTHAEGRPAVWVDNQAVQVSVLAETLGCATSEPGNGPIVVLADTARRHAFKVDRLVGQRDVVVKGLSRVLPNLPAIAGASVEPDGSVLLVLDPPGLIHRARQASRTPQRAAGPQAVTQARRILVVDDALTVRELQRSILERAGHHVRVAVDGSQALSMLAEQPSDLVLTDIEMPNMDGFALTEAIRSHPSLANIPVLILSSRSSDADRQRGLDAGADGYIVKSGFDEGALLSAVDRLVGGRV